MKDLRIIETGNRFGCMNKGGMPKDWSPEQKDENFKQNWQAVGAAFGFDPLKKFMADQKHKTGTSFELTKDYVEANPNGWADIAEDILIITKNVPGVVAGHPVADCPVIVMKDKKQGVTAVCHCSAKLIDKKMPMMMADALQAAYKTRDEDIYTYVSSCAGPDWTYKKNIPVWATDLKMWGLTRGLTTGTIDFDENDVIPTYHINLRNIIEAQLVERNISLAKTSFSDVDTITNPDYYSNYAASVYGLNQEEKYGRNFVGAFYKGDYYNEWEAKAYSKIKSR